ncbi:MAG: transcription elongation factor GreA [Thermoleophilia bacterium]|jgi:transcription elongation factor GreA|nr:transcription elongation factor GreA [Thermoleophilia bacterium]
MTARETIVTKAGFEKLRDEHAHLINVKRLEIAERIKVAREYGDISENAEYDDAKNEQARVESRIIQLEDALRTIKIIEDVDTKEVGIGNKVTVLEKGSKTPEVFLLVGSTEADPLDNKVSNESPFGAALMGKKKGDKVVVPAPKGSIEYEIQKIGK